MFNIYDHILFTDLNNISIKFILKQTVAII